MLLIAPDAQKNSFLSLNVKEDLKVPQGKTYYMNL